MRLVLKNFRHHTKLDLIIPDKGLVLLRGASGSGKSTILTAIEFALYGRVKKPYHFGTKTCSVLLEMGGVSIFRSRTPNRLVVTTGDQSYEDAVAESMIVKMIGLNEDEFNVSSYIRQKTESSLLYMGPTKQMEFLEKVAFQDAPVTAHDLKKRCSDYATLLKEKGIAYKSKYDYATQRLNEMTYTVGPKPTKVYFDEDEYQQKVQLWKDTGNKISVLLSLQQDMEKVSSCKSQIKKVKSKIEAKQKKIADELDDLKVPWVGMSKSQATKKLESLKVQKKKCVEQQNNLVRLHQLQKLLAEKKESYQSDTNTIRSKIKLLPDCHKDIEILREEISRAISDNDLVSQKLDIEQRLKEIGCKGSISSELRSVQKQIEKQQRKRKEYEEKLIRYQMYLELQECPECHVSLRFVDGSLELADTEHVNHPDSDPTDKIKSITKTLEQLQQKHNTLQKWSSYEDLLEKDITVTDEASLKEKLVELESQQHRRTLLQNRLDTITKSFKVEVVKLEKEISELESDLSPSVTESVDLLEQQIEEIGQYLTKNEQYEKERNRLLQEQKCEDMFEELQQLKQQLTEIKPNQDVENLDQRIIDLSSMAGELETYLVDADQRKKDAEKYHSYRSQQKQLRRLQKEVDQFKSKYDITLQKQEAYAVLKEKIKNAEAVALEQATDAINEYASYFLQSMFVDNPVTVTLQTTKVTKTTQKHKSEINTVIQLRGYKYDSIDQISGGEQDRISLAFVLAMNRLFNSKMLLLDECIASLDAGLNSDIIDILHDYARDKLVLVVSHEANPSLFDEVVRVN